MFIIYFFNLLCLLNNINIKIKFINTKIINIIIFNIFLYFNNIFFKYY